MLNRKYARYFTITVLLLVLIILSLLFVPLFEGTYLHAVVTRIYLKWTTLTAHPKESDVFLDIKFDKQDHSLSCEVAVLKMALDYRGVKVDEAELIEKVGFDTTPRQQVNGAIVWGNPHEAFVGNINGKLLNDGYGVYWEPIAEVGKDYRDMKDFTGWEVKDLVRELKNNNPVLVWGYLGNGKLMQWNTPEGTLIKAVHYEHAFVVNGFRGSEDKPNGFFLIDPIYGQTYYSLSTFLKKWNSLDNSGVVVY